MDTYDLNKKELDIIVNLLIRELKENGAFSTLKRIKKWNSHNKVCDSIGIMHDFHDVAIDLLWSVCKETYERMNVSTGRLLSSFAVIRFLFLLMENKSLYHLDHIELEELVNNELQFICRTLFPEMKIHRLHVTLSELKNICGDDIINDFREIYINLKPIIIPQNKIKCLE